MTELQELEPPRPRFGGRGPAVLGVAGLAGALLVFLLGLIIFNVLPNPLGSGAGAGQPPPAGTPGPSQLAKSARFAQPGECVLNTGSDTKPNMIMVLCAPGVLEVLERIEGTTNVEECRKVPDYRYHYFYDSELGDSFDFVLCMLKRP